MTDITDLRGLGPQSKVMLRSIGVNSVEQFMASDVFALYVRLKSSNQSTSLNLLYAMIGAQENRNWQEIKRERRLEVLLRLEALGIV
ncbi:TfoX/Sxy family DNA transformation protein [Undibacterium amnicola]|uniref:TfoX/Sxy family DNA transformation protein n=1 Tax=Undibacterium amnicola TaxID=1834038 RepID=A0ABR6XS55_9BURK|nr:TfoX/Sxy family DNA transformation protein [Undibacterium amnicola]MBC3832318.1 TfoX/Sxy family DNA transformation protein [Undibacterium amnicola]